MKAQRLKITERGWETYSDYLGGIKFENGISVDPVSPAIANQLGSALRMEAIDDAEQVGNAAVLKNAQNQKAIVKTALTEKTPDTVANNGPRVVAEDKYTREQLEAIADERGIGGLREIAEKFGVKGRGIVELITEILKAQG